MSASLEPVRLADDASSVRIIDQRLLPGSLVFRDLRTLDEVVDAIRTLAVRGAPAIGICAAAGLAVAVRADFDRHPARTLEESVRALHQFAATIAGARPTAVNLAWAIRRCVESAVQNSNTPDELAHSVAREARAIQEEDLAMGRAIAANGLTLLGDPLRVLTHCNTGALATGGVGTALAPLYAAHEAGRSVTVYADETRPLLQGARLTSWELARAGIDVTVLVDGAAAMLMRAGKVDAVLVGADRIAANGDTANKIGTYSLAVNAARHGVPFYVLAPQSTVDSSTRTGDDILIEERAREELSLAGNTTVIGDGIRVWNPAFDVTPADLITAIVTDRAVFRGPYAFTQ